MIKEDKKELYSMKDLAAMFGRTPQAMMWFVDKYEIDVVLVPRGETMFSTFIPANEIEKMKRLIELANDRKVWKGDPEKREYHRQATRKSYLKKKTRNIIRAQTSINMSEKERDVAFDFNGRAKRCIIKGGSVDTKILIEYFVDGLSYMAEVKKEQLLSITDDEIQAIIDLKTKSTHGRKSKIKK